MLKMLEFSNRRQTDLVISACRLTLLLDLLGREVVPVFVGERPWESSWLQVCCYRGRSV